MLSSSPWRQHRRPGVRRVRDGAAVDTGRDSVHSRALTAPRWSKPLRRPSPFLKAAACSATVVTAAARCSRVQSRCSTSGYVYMFSAAAIRVQILLDCYNNRTTTCPESWRDTRRRQPLACVEAARGGVLKTLKLLGCELPSAPRPRPTITVWLPPLQCCLPS